MTWLQEHTSPVYVVCTMNQIDAIPEAFLRQGRFDAIFGADLPVEAALQVGGTKGPFPGKAHEVPVGLQHEENAGIDFGSGDFGFNRCMPTLAEDDAEVG